VSACLCDAYKCTGYLPLYTIDYHTTECLTKQLVEVATLEEDETGAKLEYVYDRGTGISPLSHRKMNHPPAWGNQRQHSLTTSATYNTNKAHSTITTALHEACRDPKHHRDTIIKLVLSGANVHVRDMYTETPLHVLCGHVQSTHIPMDAFMCLVEHAADPNATNAQGITPLQYASECGQVDIVEYLCQHTSANIHHVDQSGKTALHRAAIMQDNCPVIECLLRHGANIHQRDGKQWTPLHYAAWYGRLDHVATLLLTDHHAASEPLQSSSTHHHGVTPLHLAKMNHHVLVARLLEQYEEQQHRVSPSQQQQQQQQHQQHDLGGHKSKSKRRRSKKHRGSQR
jgi:ankyrin repeat protein